EVQRITIDPAEFAPKNWNGKLWIGLLQHNTGPGKWIAARIVNGGAADVPQLDEPAKWKLLVKHHEDFLRYAIVELDKDPHKGETTTDVVEPMKAYLANSQEVSPVI